MQETVLWMILWVWIGLLLGYLFAKLYFWQDIKKYRQQAVKQSKAVTLGYVNEKLAPLLPNFPYNYKDLMFLGKWVDYLVFDGLSSDRIKNVIFLEIKSGKSRLNKNEQMIKEAIDAGRVKYAEYRI